MEMQQWRGSWDRAQSARDALCGALEALGVPQPVRDRLRPVVSSKGAAWVEPGLMAADVVEHIAEAIRTGLTSDERQRSQAAWESLS